MLYPIVFTPDENGTVVVKVPDFPSVISSGVNERDAEAMALDALLCMVAYHIAEKLPVPLPSKAPKSCPRIELPPLVVAKIAIHNAMLEQGVSQVALAARLRSDPKSIRRLLNIDHASKWEQLEKALEVLGYRIHAKVDPRPVLPTFYQGQPQA